MVDSRAQCSIELLISLLMCTVLCFMSISFCVKKQKKRKEGKIRFIDDDDPKAKSMYQIKTEIAFSKVATGDSSGSTSERATSTYLKTF
uniref:Uncharacterized protein n=1 Tax=Ascaris lumbricoides TaxID=6252 RepID=A0A0M3IDZ1_ASCLU